MVVRRESERSLKEMKYDDQVAEIGVTLSAMAFRKMSQLRYASGMNKILENLYLGGVRDGCDEEQLKKNKIKRVVVVYESTTPSTYKNMGISVLKIPIPDTATAPLAQYFRSAIRFIHEGRCNNEAVFVHCMAGVSRSASIVAAYLIAACDLTLFNSISFIAARRPKVNPNFGFRMMLCKFADKSAEHVRRELRETLGATAFDRQWLKDREETKTAWITQTRSDSWLPAHPASSNTLRIRSARTRTSSGRSSSVDRARRATLPALLGMDYI